MLRSILARNSQHRATAVRGHAPLLTRSHQRLRPFAIPWEDIQIFVVVVEYRKQHLICVQVLAVPPLLVVCEDRQGAPILATDREVINVDDESCIWEDKALGGLHCCFDTRESPVIVSAAQPVYFDRSVPYHDQSGVAFAQFVPWNVLVERLQGSRYTADNSSLNCQAVTCTFGHGEHQGQDDTTHVVQIWYLDTGDFQARTNSLFLMHVTCWD